MRLGFVRLTVARVGWGWWWTIRFNPLFSLLIHACIYVRNQATWEKVLLHVRLDQVNS